MSIIRVLYLKQTNVFQVIDVGDGYNSQDGIFNVPVTGVYVFTYTIYTYHHYVRTELVINGQVKTTAMTDAESADEVRTATAILVISANAGDHVFVRRADTHSQCNIFSSITYVVPTFSGWILY